MVVRDRKIETDCKQSLRTGKIKNAPVLISREKNQVIIPGKHHIAKLIALQLHEEVQHHNTRGAAAIRAGGFWIIGGKRIVSSITFSCVKCRKLRGKLEGQKMVYNMPKESNYNQLL